MKIDISKMDKAEVLAALYNNSKTQGMGILHYENKPMKIEEARDILKGQTYFDYLKGRVLKIDLSGDILNTALYNRDNGTNAAEIALGIET
jgi:hypothetical protein